MIWVLVGILVLGELFVALRILGTLVQGVVSINPVAWFGYGEFADLSVDRATAPATYWFVMLMVTALAVVFAGFIYLLAMSAR